VRTREELLQRGARPFRDANPCACIGDERETHSIRELCDVAFGHVGLDWTDAVVQDDRVYRPAEVDLLIGDPPEPVRRSGGSRAPASQRWSR
jgi:hypothetical protein